LSRILKDPETRRLEIISASLELFTEKGYQKTAVSDIVRRIGVAQGTFYHYFKSKEEVIDAIINSYVDLIINIIIPIIDDEKLNAMQKLEKILVEEFSLVSDKSEMNLMLKLHMVSDLNVHQKFLKAKVLRYSPVVVKIIEQGKLEGYFNLKHPLEALEILLVGFHFLFDPGILPYDEKEYFRRANAASDIIESVLKVKEGCFGFFSSLIINEVRRLNEYKKSN